MKYSVINQLITLFSDIQRYNDEFYKFHTIIGNILSLTAYIIFGFLLYRIYRNLANNTYTKRKIIISLLLNLTISILTFASVLIWFASIAGICGNNCSGVGRFILNAFL